MVRKRGYRIPFTFVVLMDFSLHRINHVNFQLYQEDIPGQWEPSLFATSSLDQRVLNPFKRTIKDVKVSYTCRLVGCSPFLRSTTFQTILIHLGLSSSNFRDEGVNDRHTGSHSKELPLYPYQQNECKISVDV